MIDKTKLTERAFYTGIGSRKTPAEICNLMTEVAGALEAQGWKLRSGHAEGADLAFEKGVIDPRNKEIYIPWPGFNDSPSILHQITDEMCDMAARFHPNWSSLLRGARKLHARNCCQVLGEDLKTPSAFVMCWTPDGSDGTEITRRTGGTGQALRIANYYKIPIYNLAREEHLVNVKKWLEQLKKQ